MKRLAVILILVLALYALAYAVESTNTARIAELQQQNVADMAVCMQIDTEIARLTREKENRQQAILMRTGAIQELQAQDERAAADKAAKDTEAKKAPQKEGTK